MAPAVVFYDGVCGFCDHTVRFVLQHDDAGAFRFAPLQSRYATAVLARHGRDAADLDTVCLLVDPDGPGERLLARSDAIFAIFDGLGGIWRIVALGRFAPQWLRDAAYGAFARRRYRWFGRFDECRLPSPRLRERFVSQALEEIDPPPALRSLDHG